MMFANEYEYQPDGNDFIPMERWGKDHWSTFAYLEICTVDAKGKIDRNRMRCNARLHRELASIYARGLIDGPEYPTRCKDGDVPNHDDWSCLEDMVAAGLVRAYFIQTRFDAFGNTDARVELTDAGRRIASELRQHKADGGSFHAFVSQVVPV